MIWIHRSGTDSKESALQLLRTYDYPQLVNFGQEHQWKDADDPEVLMAYSRALLETGRLIPDGLRAPNVPEEVAAFAAAYFELLRGRVSYAEEQFRLLRKGDRGKLWGYLGQLEASLVTEDYVSMGRLLSEDQPSVPPNQPRFEMLIQHYGLMHLSGTAQYARLAQHLDAEQGRSLPAQWTAPLHAALLLRQNDFGQANKVIDEALAKSKFDPHVVLAKASVMSAEKGTAAAAAYLKDVGHKYPHAWPLILHRVGYEFEASVISAKDVVNTLARLGRGRVFDASSLIMVASTLVDFGDSTSALQLLDNLAASPDELIRFQSYSLLMAKWDELGGHAHSFANNVRRAREMYPADPAPLWLLYSAASKGKKSSEALQALEGLLKLDPYDRPALQALTRVHEDAGHWEKVIEVGNRFFGSQRVISAAAEKEVRDRMQRASGKLAATPKASSRDASHATQKQ